MLERFAGEGPIVRFAWIAAALFACFYFYVDAANMLSRGTLAVGNDTIFGRDFINVYTGGRLVLEGRFTAPYDLVGYEAYQQWLTGGIVNGHNYSYGPVSFLYVWFFALFPYPVAYLLWTGLTAAAFVLAARPYLVREGLPAWVAVLVPAAAANIWAGHYGFVVGALLLGAFRWLDERPRLAGILVGLMIVKPHLALLMPIVLLRRRAWLAFGYAGLTVLVLVNLSALIFGWEPWRLFLGSTLAHQAQMVDDVTKFFLQMMPTIAPTLFLTGVPASLTWPIQGVVAAAAIAALWLRMPRDPMTAGLATACATFLVLPYAFIYDMTAVGIAAVILLHRAERTRPLTVAFAALAFLLPLTAVFFIRSGLPVAPAIMAGMLAMLLRQARVEAPALGRLAPQAA